MATFYIDGRVATSGNGTSPSTAFKTHEEATLLANVPNGSTIEVIEGSGPYPGLRHINDGSHNKSLTWYFNGNSIQNDLDVNAQGWRWQLSANELYPETYYLTNLAGTASPLTLQPKSCEIWAGSIWYWMSESRNLFSANGGDWYPYKWGWGDKDSLGFSTLYIQGVGDPTGDPDIKIYVPHAASLTYALMVQYSRLTNQFNDAIIRGSNVSLLGIGCAVEFNRCEFRNADMEIFTGLSNGTLTPSGTVFKFCKFLTGHNGLTISGTNTYGNIGVYHSHFERIHLMARTLAETPCTLTLKNNSSKNLLAGGICWDHTTPVLVEDHNQFHLDPQSTHAGKSLGWTNGTRHWLETAATDWPASTSTTLTTSVDPQTDTAGKITSTLSRLVHGGAIVAGVNDGAQSDPWGNQMIGQYPNIGPDQYDYAPGYGPWVHFDGDFDQPVALSSNAIGSVLRVVAISGAPHASLIKRMVEFG